MVSKYKVVIRFTNGDSDREFRFSNEIEAFEWFKYLVLFELDSLMHNIWCICLLRGHKPIRNYDNFVNH